MRRRSLLRAAPLGGVGLLAGCTGEESPADGADAASPSESPRATSTDSPTPSPTPKPTLAEQTFSVASVDCGTTGNSVEADVDGDVVVVTGITDAPDPCYSARLVEAETGCSDGTLRVGVETFVPPENEDKACAQCIAGVEYEARFTFEGPVAGRLVVRHDGEQVADTEIGD